ncbi:tight adherence protein B [Okibacterium sp. HSC-33S16]|uniref:type II secretion system F family protein n=1 Tax=Okibacterium sp. HSC-33S16 TaxID=2910965 RepID=UPI00209E1C64|nr:type II secretion system F family protein [Okibacterium sp. HSC-33S16]MCP2032218.1 tight adherence protein B [Okibacterium sp. HSC-33S16]
MRKTDAPLAVEAVAALTERLAVLLGAGVPPASAWQYLADAPASSEQASGETGLVVTAAALAARDGIDVPAAMVSAAPDGPAGEAWRSVAAAWSVAIGTGARLGPCLSQLARSQRALGQTQRDIDAALAGPRSTSRLVLALPAVGLLFGSVLGFDTLGTLFGTVPGLVCLVSGGMLAIIAWRWSNRMVRRAVPRTSAPGLEIDLLAIALSSGASIDRARATVETALAESGLTRGDSRRSLQTKRAVAERRGGMMAGAPLERSTVAIDGVLALSRAAGIPAAELLVSEADAVRRDARSRAQRSAAALGTRLMLPLGVCILPAFMLVGLAPLMLSVLSSTVAGFG